MSKQPTSIKLISGLMYVWYVITILFAIFFMQVFSTNPVDATAYLVLLAWGIFMIYTTRKLSQGINWARILTMIVVLIWIIMSLGFIIMFFSTVVLIMILFGAMVIYYLTFDKETVSYFK